MDIIGTRLIEVSFSVFVWSRALYTKTCAISINGNFASMGGSVALRSPPTFMIWPESYRPGARRRETRRNVHVHCSIGRGHCHAVTWSHPVPSKLWRIFLLLRLPLPTYWKSLLHPLGHIVMAYFCPPACTYIHLYENYISTGEAPGSSWILNFSDFSHIISPHI